MNPHTTNWALAPQASVSAIPPLRLMSRPTDVKKRRWLFYQTLKKCTEKISTLVVLAVVAVVRLC